MAKALQCPWCSSPNFKKLNDYQVKCKNSGNVYQSYDHTGFSRTVIQEAGFITIDERLSMVRGLIAGKQYSDALARLHDLEDERGGMDEFQFLKAKALSQNFTIADDPQIKNLLDSAESTANRNGNEELQEEVMEVRQRLARAETARPVRDNLKMEEERFNDARNKERQVRSNIESLQTQHAQISQEISILQTQLRKKGRSITLNRCLRLIPFIIGIALIIIAALAGLRSFPEASKDIEQKAPNIYFAVNDFIAKNTDIPFIASSPVSIGSLLGNIPTLNSTNLSDNDDLILMIVSALLGLISLRIAIKNRRAKTKKASLKKDKAQVSTLKEKLKNINQNLSDRKKELDARLKARQEIEANVNTLQTQLNKLIGD